MSNQKEIDLVKNVIADENTQEVVELITTIPRDLRLV